MKRNAQQDRIQTLLRAQRGAQLSPQFRRAVLDAVASLPDPGLLPEARQPRLALWLAAGLVTLMLGALSLALPHYSATLAAWQWELSDLNVALSFGSVALSASLLSILVASVGAAVITLLGWYGRRNHLLGA